MSVKTDGLREQIQARLEQARQISENAEKDGWSAESRQDVERLFDEAKELKAQLDDEHQGGELRRRLNELSAEIGGGQPGARHGGGGVSAAGRSLGARFVNSDQYKQFRGQWSEGRIPDRARVSMQPVPFKSLFKETPSPPASGGDSEGGLISITGDGGHGGLVIPDYQGLVDVLGRPELNMRNLVSVRTTTSDTVHYVRQLSRVNAADWVPEATDLDPESFPTGETGIKPLGGFEFEEVTAVVGTLAEWLAATKRAIMDVGQLRGLIDQELRGNLRDKEEVALLYGGGDIEGLDNTEGVQEQEFDTDLFTTTRKARTLVRFNGFAVPTAYLLSVEDDEKIDLERDSDGRFFGAGPFAMGPNTLWGLPRIASPYVKEGEAWLADWRRAVIWDRQQATISMSDSHADFFTRNLVAVLGEQREAFGVIRPSAFVKIETAD